MRDFTSFITSSKLVNQCEQSQTSECITTKIPNSKQELSRYFFVVSKYENMYTNKNI